MHVQDFRIVQPQGLNAVGNFAAEVMRGKFLHDIGFAIVHSKVIVIDPNGDKPIVVTGSHNFSAAVSGKNDENLVIIEGNKALATVRERALRHHRSEHASDDVAES